MNDIYYACRIHLHTARCVELRTTRQLSGVAWKLLGMLAIMWVVGNRTLGDDYE
jgi:hypothetical protein